MPIIGLTDQAAKFPIIGVLRKGEKKVSEKRPGKDLTYFRFTSEDSLALADFYEAYPNETTQRHINVFLPHKTTDENMDSWMEQWVAGGLVHRCDGKVTTLWRTDKGDYSTEAKACPGGCKQVGRLSVIVPELGRFATVTVQTTSIHDIKNLTQQLRGYESLQGDLRGIPFVITRRPRFVSTPAPDGKRVRREKWLLSIETQPEYTKAQIASMAHEALPQIPDVVDSPHYMTIEGLPAGVVSPNEEFPEPTNGNVAQPPVDSAPEPEPAPKQSEIDPARPYSPGELRNKVRAFIAVCEEKQLYVDPESSERLPITLHPFGERTPQLLAAKMQEVLEDIEGVKPEDAYHKVLNWFFFNVSANDLKAAEAAAMFRILFNGKAPDEISFKTPVLDVAKQELVKVYEVAKEEIDF